MKADLRREESIELVLMLFRADGQARPKVKGNEKMKVKE